MNDLIYNAAFGKNDLRGIVGKVITPELFEEVGKAYAKYIIDKTGQEGKHLWVSVGQDARLHSPDLADAVIEGLLSSGVNVIDLGLCPTPLAYYSEFITFKDLKPKSHVGTMIITASHNPAEYNGLKVTFKKATLTEDEFVELKEITKSGNFIESYRTGVCKKHDITQEYINSMVSSFSLIGKGIKLVVDSGNATGGIVAPELYRELGCEVIDIFTEPDGRFPAHHPNPSDEKNLKHLKQKVAETNADFGIAFDGDSDRVGIIDNTGYAIPGDQLLLIFALDIINQLSVRNEKPVFVSEVKCSQVLYDEINRNGGQAIMWKTGHAYIKAKMKETNAILSGEMSGHIFFRDRYYGFDDAFYAGCRFIEIIAKNKANNPNFKPSHLIEALPKTYTSPEVRIPCPNELKQNVLELIRQEIDHDSDIFGTKIVDIITIDGLRVVFNGGFALIRASNTEPTFTLRFEGDTLENKEKYQGTMLEILDKSMEKLRTRV